MYLKRSITVNWGNLPPQEFEYGPVNLFSGGNGSGKTTAADALQTLMTAAHDNLFNYNPGQDETTQRGRGGKQVRTLASYILGCDDGAFARPFDSDGYIAGVFYPTNGESAEPFTAVIGVRAHLDRAGNTSQARQDELLLMIVSGEELKLSHFVRTYPDGEHVVHITDLPDFLRKEFGKKIVETYDKKGAYLSRLYGALRGKRDAVSQREAKNAAYTFASFMAYKPVKSIDQFVAGEVLEQRDMGDTIRKIRDLLRTVHGMEQEANRIKTSVAQLEIARDHSDRYIDHWLEDQALIYGVAANALHRNQRAYLSAKEEQTNLKRTLEELAEEKRLIGDRLEQAHGVLVELEARRLGIPALHTKDQLEKQRARLQDDLKNNTRPLIEQDQQRQQNLTSLRNLRDLLSRQSIELEILEFSSRGFHEEMRELLATDSSMLPDVNQLLAHDWIDLRAVEAGLDNLQSHQQLHNRIAARLHDQSDDNPSLAYKLQRIVEEREKIVQNTHLEIAQTARQISALEAKQITYPQHVDKALQAIRQQCPAADPRVLCDYIEVSDPEWQMAIEGYIGGARFGILVEPKYEAEAIRIVRSLAGRNDARVIQGEKAQRDSEKKTLKDNSIIHVMRFSHRIAEHYMRASYGDVERVDNEDTLRLTRRGITSDGKGSGNYAMFRCDLDDSQLVFGESARERNLAAQQQTLTRLQDKSDQVNRDYQAVKQVAAQVMLFRHLDQATIVMSMVDCQRQLRSVNEQLSALDLSEHHDLEQKLVAAQSHHKELKLAEGTATDKYSRIDQDRLACERRIEDFADRSESLEEEKEHAEASLMKAARYVPVADIEQRIALLDQQLQQGHIEINFDDRRHELNKSLTQCIRSIDSAIAEYNANAPLSDNIIPTTIAELHSFDFLGHICGMRQQIDKLHNRLRNNVLLEKQEKLAELRETFNTTFVSDLCHEIRQAVNDGKRTLDGLNKELQHHHFGADRERFEFDWEWIPEFKEYWDFFGAVSEIPNLGDGSSLFDNTLPEKLIAVRDRLLALLLEGDEQQAIRELERISDYRHYRRYDILKYPEGKSPIRLSEYGTGSGGQLETPAYIIRAAAVTSAFRFNEGDSHLRMVIVDEAFMHMDENRSREVINYLTQTLGLQLIFIMPTSKAGPFLDLISNQFVFSKVPSSQKIGELNTRVLVDRQQWNTDRVAELWAQHRRVIRQQGMLDFMEEV